MIWKYASSNEEKDGLGFSPGRRKSIPNSSVSFKSAIPPLTLLTSGLEAAAPSSSVHLLVWVPASSNPVKRNIF